MTPNLRFFWLLICCLVGLTSAADAVEQRAKLVDRTAIISFQTLDGDIEQIDLDQIWRIRAASTRDEPVGATVIDYAFERLFVKDPLEKVVEQIGKQRDVKQFTLPSGAPVYIIAEKVIGITRAIPAQHHPNSKSIINAREGALQVQESRQTIRDALGK
jgi:hypothetical protein